MPHEESFACNVKCHDAQAALVKEGKEKPKRAPAIPRSAGGEKWWDPSLADWPENDFRIFVGDLGNECNDDVLSKAFQKYSSFAKAKVVRDKKSNKTKGTCAAGCWASIRFLKLVGEANPIIICLASVGIIVQKAWIAITLGVRLEIDHLGLELTM